MYRRALVLCLSLVGVFAVASPAAAVAGFTTGLQNPVCTHSGAQFGHGKIAATAYFSESGNTGTNYFRSIAQVQVKKASGWAAYNPKTARKSSPFPDSTNGYHWSITWKYSFAASEVGHKYRVQLTYEFWDRNTNPDHVIAHFTRIGPTCKA